MNDRGQTRPEAKLHVELVKHQICLLLGSNIRPERNLRLAVRMVRRCLTVLKASAVWESEAVGTAGPNFLNAALLCASELEPEALKWRVLRPLEAQMGRVRNEDKNAPRPIDFDIITVDGQLLEPQLWQYSFRAVPVAELLPDLRSETGDRLVDAARALGKIQPLIQRNDILLKSS